MKRKLNVICKTSFGVILLASTFFIGSINNSYAANINFMSVNSDKEVPKPLIQNSVGSFYEDLSSYNLSTSEFSSKLTTWFNLNEDHAFESVRNFNDEIGYTIETFQHYYKGIAVENDLVFIHSKNGKIESVNGQVISFDNVDVNVSISDEEVLAIAIEDFGTTENVLKSEIKHFVSKINTKEGVKIVATKKINLSSIMPLKNTFYYIDDSGKIVNQFQGVYHADVPGTGSTYYRGNQNITVDSYNGQYRLKDNLRNIHTLNGSNLSGQANTVSGELIGGQEYINSSTSYTQNPIKPVVDIHWGIAKTYDYYKNTHNRNSYDGNGSIIRNYYNPPANINPADNAGALDTQGIVAMVYGAGAQFFNPVVGLDVAGHEFSHLVIGRNGNGGLNYQGESGALNESFADMFGAAIEFKSVSNPNWTIGEGIAKPIINPSYMRNMANPNAASSNFGFQQPDTYGGTYWADPLNLDDEDYGGVHTNSGVGNFWFYLLSDQNIHTGTNDIGNSYYVAGIGINKAEKIAYRALTQGLTPTATFMDAFNATKQAAVQLYGNNSNEYNQVVNAWYAVGIGSAAASIDQNEFKTRLIVYPNPTNGTFSIDSQLDSTTTVQVYDLLGKQVSQIINLDKGSNSINIDYLSNGVYQLVFKSEGVTHSQKLIKN